MAQAFVVLWREVWPVASSFYCQRHGAISTLDEFSWPGEVYLPPCQDGCMRGEVCTVWGGRDRCYPGGNGNACPRAGGEPATAGVLSYCSPPSTCSPKENVLPSPILCWQWNVWVVIETGMWAILNPCPLQWVRTPRGLCCLSFLCSLTTLLRGSVFMMLYCNQTECSLLCGQGCHPPNQGGPIQPGLEWGLPGMGHPQLLWAASSSASAPPQ